jgi:hypothetical protein
MTVCDLRNEPSDRRLMFLTLQGIVNRARPQIYCLTGSNDQQWLDWMLRKGWVRSAVVAKSNDELLQRYRRSVKGMVVTDPSMPATVNVATMLASLDDAIAVSPALAKQISLPVLIDLRGKWTTSADAYRWAFDHLWPQLNHHVIACLWPNYLALRDYLVENKVFTFWISGPDDGDPSYASSDNEAKLMGQLLAKMPVNIPVMGYPLQDNMKGFGEGPGVSLFAKFGKYVVGSIDCANLSVHSGVPVGKLRQKPAVRLTLDPSKVYLSWVISDGDNLPVVTKYNYPQLWKDPVRGKLPLGWSLSPSASVLMPDIVSYYYDTATASDEFLSSVDGVGYTYPDIYGTGYSAPYRQKILDGFLQETATTMRRSDMTDLWLHNESNEAIISRFAERIPFIEAIFPDYGKRVSTYAEATYPTAGNVPVFHAVTSVHFVDFNARYDDANRKARIMQLVDDIHAITSERPAFLHAFTMNWYTDLPMIQEVMSRLGSNYVAVRPDQLAALYREHLKSKQGN